MDLVKTNNNKKNNNESNESKTIAKSQSPESSAKHPCPARFLLESQVSRTFFIRRHKRVIDVKKNGEVKKEKMTENRESASGKDPSIKRGCHLFLSLFYFYVILFYFIFCSAGLYSPADGRAAQLIRING